MFNAPNGIQHNLLKDVYIASKKSVEYDDYNNEVVNYDVPFKLGKFNIQPLTGNSLEAYIQVYGETQNLLIRTFLDLKYKDMLKEFDVAYLYGNTPFGEALNGDNANYTVRTYKEQNTKIMIIFEEIIKEDN